MDEVFEEHNKDRNFCLKNTIGYLCDDANYF